MPLTARPRAVEALPTPVQHEAPFSCNSALLCSVSKAGKRSSEAVLGSRVNGTAHDFSCGVLIKAVEEEDPVAEQHRFGFCVFAVQMEDVHRIHAGRLKRTLQGRSHSARRKRFPVDLPPALDGREQDRVTLLCHD